MSETVVKRSEKLAFYGVKGDSGTITYHRMAGFTDISTSKNPKEYSRQYVDEDAERTDVVGYAPSIAYGFDYFKGNVVHEDLIKISDDELMGQEATRSILIVDVGATGPNAMKRDFAVIPDSEGDSTDAYTYSGNLKAKGAKVKGTAASTDGWQTCTFTEPSEEPGA